MGKNTLIITKNFYPEIGGVETYILEFIKYFIKKKSGIIYVITPKESILPAIFRNNKRVKLICPKFNITFTNPDVNFNIISTSIQICIYLFFVFSQSIILLLKQPKISNIIGIGGSFSISLSFLLGSVFNRKKFGHFHADFQFKKRSFVARSYYKLVFNRLDRIFVNSKDVLKDLVAIGVRKVKINIINNWVDANIFKIKDKKKIRRKLKLPLDKKILLFVGRLSTEKGIEEVLHCASILGERKDLIFIIVGLGPLQNLAIQYAENNKNIYYLGPKKPFELTDYYNASDFLLWGSLDVYYVSITIMEALHCGLPVIAPAVSTQGGKEKNEKFAVDENTLPPEVGILIKTSGEKLTKSIDNMLSKDFNRKIIKEYALKKYSEKNADPVLFALDS